MHRFHIFHMSCAQLPDLYDSTAASVLQIVCGSPDNLRNDIPEYNKTESDFRFGCEKSFPWYTEYPCHPTDIPPTPSSHYRYFPVTVLSFPDPHQLLKVPVPMFSYQSHQTNIPLCHLPQVPAWEPDFSDHSAIPFPIHKIQIQNLHPLQSYNCFSLSADTQFSYTLSSCNPAFSFISSVTRCAKTIFQNIFDVSGSSTDMIPCAA